MKLTLRRVKPADAAAIAEQFGDPDVFGGTLQLPFASEEMWVQRIAGLHPVGPSVRRRHAMGLGITVAKASQGQGVGQALMTALLDYADNWAPVLRTQLTVYHDNQRAIRLYERHSFAPEVRLKAYALRNGAYEDVVTMARPHPRQPLVGPT